MKRKISLVLFMLVLILSFAGCAKQSTTSASDKELMIAYADAIIEWLPSNTEEDIQFYRDLSEFDLNVVLSANLQLPTTPENFIGMLDSWEAAKEECGELILEEEYDFSIKENTDGFVVSTPAKFEERDATISVCFDKKYNITLFEVAAKYSMSEIMSKAGINTLLGMGVVFTVLIFLAFIIGQMKLIPRFLGKKEKTETKMNTESVAPVATQTEAVDDLELIAVIMAAIAAKEGKTAEGFVVRSIRRRPSNRWK